MSSFTSGDGVEHFIFGKDGGKKIANTFNIELLGQIPINIDLRKKSDEGVPLTETSQILDISNIFRDIIKKILISIMK
jgi:ATP-binding protein involved in chromosome partitioning